MASFTDIVEGLAANLASIAGLNEHAYILSSPALPAVEVFPQAGVYDRTFQRGLDSLTFTVRVLVATTTDQGAQRALYSFMDPYGATSIKAAVESDATLGAAAEDVHVTGWSQPQLFDRGGIPALGVEFQVEVWIKGRA